MLRLCPDLIRNSSRTPRSFLCEALKSHPIKEWTLDIVTLSESSALVWRQNCYIAATSVLCFSGLRLLPPGLNLQHASLKLGTSAHQEHAHSRELLAFSETMQNQRSLQPSTRLSFILALFQTQDEAQAVEEFTCFLHLIASKPTDLLMWHEKVVTDKKTGFLTNNKTKHVMGTL